MITINVVYRQRNQVFRAPDCCCNNHVSSGKAERELYEAHQQIRALQYDASGGGSGSGGGDALTHLRIADALREDVARLTKQLVDVKGERDGMAARLERGGGGGSEEGGELVREMKLQLIEKDARIQAMESQCASLKRSSVIQAVELQELHDHLNGLEKQKSLQEVQRFPPLPPLSSIHESPYEQIDDEDGKMKAIMLADEALQV